MFLVLTISWHIQEVGYQAIAQEDESSYPCNVVCDDQSYRKEIA